MSLAIALEGVDGIVLAADSRGTIGDPRGLTAINDSQVKLFRLSQYVGVCTFGSGEVGAEVCHRLQALVQKEFSDAARIDAIEHKTRQHARGCYDDWFARFPVENRPALGLILGGILGNDRPRSLLLVSQLDFAPQPTVAGFMAGGIPQYATYLTHRLFDPSKPVRALANLAEYLISETASQDPKVGGPIKVALITAEGGYRDLSEEELEAIRTRNQEATKLLRDSFYEVDGGARNAEGITE